MERNKAIAKRFLQAWTADGQHIVDELAAPELVVFYSSWPEPVHRPEGFKQVLTETFSYFPDMRITAHEILAEGDRVMVRWSYTATHQHGTLFGYPALDKRVEVSGITIYAIVGGRVTEEHGIVDSYSLMMQLSTDSGTT